jgi:hypothetical protein
LLQVSKKNRAVLVPDTVTVEMPLLQAYDGLGAIYLMAQLDTLVLNEGAFTDPTVYSSPELRHIYVQHWAHLEPPILNSATVSGAQVVLTWTNQHRNRPIDGTAIFRNGAEIRHLPGTATSHTDPVPAAGTYTYVLKHVSPPISAVNEGPRLIEPNSPQSNPITVVVTTQPQQSPLALTIVGPSTIYSTGAYSWNGRATGGIQPYSYQWFFRWGSTGPFTELPGAIDSLYYRKVFHPGPDFTVKVRVTDSQGTVRNSQRFVDVYDFQSRPQP